MRFEVSDVLVINEVVCVARCTYALSYYLIAFHGYERRNEIAFLILELPTTRV